MVPFPRMWREGVWCGGARRKLAEPGLLLGTYYVALRCLGDIRVGGSGGGGHENCEVAEWGQR